MLEITPVHTGALHEFGGMKVVSSSPKFYVKVLPRATVCRYSIPSTSKWS